MNFRHSTTASLLTIALAASPVFAQGDDADFSSPDFTLDIPASFFSEYRLPNGGGTTLGIPTGQGAAFGAAFIGGGMTNRAPFSESADGGFSGGLGLWDPILAVGIEMTVGLSDLSEMDNANFAIKVHRDLGGGFYAAAGASNLGVDKTESDLDDPFYYGVISHVFQGTGRPGVGRVFATVGYGNGPYLNLSPLDVAEGNGTDGTGVFGALAVEVLPNVNAIGEWNGRNFATGVGFLVPFAGLPVSLTVGLADLTGYSGDGARLTVGGGLGMQLF